MPDREQTIRNLMFAREHLCLNCTYDDILDDAIKLLQMDERMEDDLK